MGLSGKTSWRRLTCSWKGGGEKQGAFVAWVSLERRVGVEAGDGMKVGALLQVVWLQGGNSGSPKVSPHSVSHQASAERGKYRSLHFIGSNLGSGNSRSYSRQGRGCT